MTLNDATVTAGKTYYYMVRAYKDKAESASSNEASAIASADGAKTDSSVTTTSATANKTKLITPLMWALGGVGILLIGLLIFLVIRRRKKAKNNGLEQSKA